HPSATPSKTVSYRFFGNCCSCGASTPAPFFTILGDQSLSWLQYLHKSTALQLSCQRCPPHRDVNCWRKLKVEEDGFCLSVLIRVIISTFNTDASLHCNHNLFENPNMKKRKVDKFRLEHPSATPSKTVSYRFFGNCCSCGASTPAPFFTILGDQSLFWLQYLHNSTALQLSCQRCPPHRDVNCWRKLKVEEDGFCLSVLIRVIISTFNTDASLHCNHNLFENLIMKKRKVDKLPTFPDTPSNTVDRNRQQERY
ncbi:hypothetical protein T265_13142, partial [Opisthorchis viverrini]